AVGIVLSDPPRLDALSFDTGPDTWEAAEADLDQSVVLVDGNAYRVHSPVSDAEGARTSDVGVLFGCSGRSALTEADGRERAADGSDRIRRRARRLRARRRG